MCDTENTDNALGNDSNISGDVKSSEPPIDRNVKDNSKLVDGRWGCVITLSSFVHSFLVDGFCYSFGTFLKEFLSYFGESNGRTQLLNSTITGFHLSLGLVSGFLMDKVGCRRITIGGVIVASVGLFLSTFSPNLDVMILLYGVVGGVGLGLLYTPSVAIVGYYFNKHRALATGIAVCGSGIGGFVFAPLSVLLIETYGWKGALWILSAIVLNGVVFAAFYRPIPKPKCLTSDSIATKTINVKHRARYKQLILAFKETLNLSILVSPTFALYSFSGILVCTGFYIPFNFLPAFAADFNLSAREGALLISVLGIFNTLSRILIGLLSDQSWADCILIYSTTLLIGGISTCLVPLCHTYAVLMAYSAIFGTTAGTFVSLKSIILVELQGHKTLSHTLGLLNFMLGIALFIGSPVAGALTDMTNSYNAAFYLSGGTIGLAGLLCFPLRHIARWEHNRNPHRNETTEPHLTSMRILHM